MLEQIIERYDEEEFLIIDGFNESIIGVEESSMRLIYSETSILNKLKEDMDEEDAIEHFDYNIKGAYVGEKTPIFCSDFE